MQLKHVNRDNLSDNTTVVRRALESGSITPMETARLLDEALHAIGFANQRIALARWGVDSARKALDGTLQPAKVVRTY